MYVLEQLDIQVFGGNAASSLQVLLLPPAPPTTSTPTSYFYSYLLLAQASLYCVLRSLLAIVAMFGFAYGGLTESSHSAHAQEVGDSHWGRNQNFTKVIHIEISS